MLCKQIIKSTPPIAFRFDGKRQLPGPQNNRGMAEPNHRCLRHGNRHQWGADNHGKRDRTPNVHRSPKAKFLLMTRKMGPYGLIKP